MKLYHSSGSVDVYHGQALDLVAAVEPFDALVTDPPYSSGGQFRGDRMGTALSKYVQQGTMAYRPDFAGDNRDQRAYFAWCALWLSLALARAKPGAHAAIFTDWRQLPTTTDALQAGGWIWRGLGTWHKPGVRMQRAGLSHSAEYVAWGTNGPWDRSNDYAAQNVFRCAPVSSATKVHVAEKPEEARRQHRPPRRSAAARPRAGAPLPHNTARQCRNRSPGGRAPLLPRALSRFP